MLTEKDWETTMIQMSNHYYNLNDGGYDERMKCHLVECSYQDQRVTYEFETQPWQMNEKGAVHGGAIAGMFDSALGTVANIVAGEHGASTAEMNVSFIRGVALDSTVRMIVYVVKAGRSLIRLRGELVDAETGKLLATGTGAWVPL